MSSKNFKCSITISSTPGILTSWTTGDVCQNGLNYNYKSSLWQLKNIGMIWNVYKYCILVRLNRETHIYTYKYMFRFPWMLFCGYSSFSRGSSNSFLKTFRQSHIKPLRAGSWSWLIFVLVIQDSLLLQMTIQKNKISELSTDLNMADV